MESIPVLFTGSIAAGAVYHAKYSPAARAEAMCKTVEKTSEIHDRTLEVIPKLSANHQKEFENAQDDAAALWDAKLDAHYIRSKVRSATWIQKHLNPNFTCIKEGEVLSMSDVEDTIYAYDESVLVTSIRAKALHKKEKEEAERRRRAELQAGGQNPPPPPPQPRQPTQPNQFAQPRASFDVDLEANRRRLVNY